MVKDTVQEGNIVIKIIAKDLFSAQAKRMTRQVMRLQENISGNMFSFNKAFRESRDMIDGLMEKSTDSLARFGFEMADNAVLAKQNQHALTDLFTGVTPQTAGFAQVMGMTNENWVQFNKQGRQFQTRGGMIANRLRMMTVGLHGFRMEMLSVMFFGMLLSGTLFGLMRPAGEAVGIFELWGITLQDLFLPTMMNLLDPMIGLLETVLGLNEETKLAIGNWTLLGIAFGVLFFIVGSVMLGIGGLITSGMLVPTLLIVGAVASAVIVWKVFGDAIKLVWGIIKNAFTTGWDFVKGIFDDFMESIELLGDLWTAIWEGDTETIKSSISDIFDLYIDSVTGFLSTLGTILLDSMATILNPIIQGLNMLPGIDIPLLGRGAVLENAIRKIEKLPEETTVADLFKPGSGINMEDVFSGFNLADNPASPPTDIGIEFPKGREPVIINQTFNGTTTEEVKRMVDEGNETIRREVEAR